MCYTQLMKNTAQGLLGIIIALAILSGLWYFYRERFDVKLEHIITDKTTCTDTLNESEGKIIKRFDEKAHAVITGTETAPVSDEMDFTNWKPSLESIKLLLDTDTLVDMALQEMRSEIAENQQNDPESLVNKQKSRISKLFEQARQLCESLPE